MIQVLDVYLEPATSDLLEERFGDCVASLRTNWKDDLILAESSRFIMCEQKFLPASCSTSWVMMAQLLALSGQNQTKGIL